MSAVSAYIAEMSALDRPLSEQFRIASKIWCDADAAATVLEELKSAVLAQKKSALIEKDCRLSEARAERLVKASADWDETIRQAVTARAEANALKMELEVIRMQHREWVAANADQRTERRLGEMHA